MGPMGFIFFAPVPPVAAGGKKICRHIVSEASTSSNIATALTLIAAKVSGRILSLSGRDQTIQCVISQSHAVLFPGMKSHKAREEKKQTHI